MQPIYAFIGRKTRVEIVLFPDVLACRGTVRQLRACKLLFCFTLIAAPTWTFADATTAMEACTECHGVDGMGRGSPMVPVIAGIPASHIEEAIYAYVDGARRCVREPRMCETVAALSESEVAEVANYFASRNRGSSHEEFDQDLAKEGELLHQQYCSNCHLPPDHKNVADAVGFPLHGQRSEYLRYAIEAYFAGEREALVEVMAEQIKSLKAGDLGALVHYYSSYRADD